MCACPPGVRCYSDEPPFGVPEETWPEVCRSGGWQDAPPRRVNEQGRESKSGIPVPDRLSVTPSEEDGGVAPPHSPTLPRPTVLTAAPPLVRTEQLFALPDPVPVRKPVDALSPSAAMEALQCPRKFEEKKVLGREEPPSRPATSGTFVHKVMEWVTAHPLPERTLDRARPLAARLWAETVRPVDDPVDLPDEASDDDERDVRGLRREVALHSRDDDWDARRFKEKVWAAVEFGVEIEPDYGGRVLHRELWLRDVTVAGVPIRGKADRIDEHDDGLGIMDYKSGSAKLDQDGRPDRRRLDEKGLQLHWYWDMVEGKLDVKVSAAALVFLGKPGQLAMWVDPKGRDAARRTLADLWANIQRWELAARADGERYEAKPGPLCWWCPFFEGCGEGAAHMTGDGMRTVYWRERKGEELPPSRVEYLGWDSDRRERWHSLADTYRH